MAVWSRASSHPTLLYSDGTSLLHRSYPLTKLAGMVWLASLGFILPAAGGALLAAVAAAVAAFSGVGHTVLRRLALTLIPLGLALFVVHGILVGRPDAVAFGFVSVSPAGIDHMLTIWARIAAILSSSLLFVTTTHPAQLLKALDHKRVSPGLAYLIASPLLLIEPFSARARAIRDAQIARGLDLDGSFKARIRALPALLLPLVTLALSDMDQRAAILNGRAFRALPYRTVLDAPVDTASQVWLRRAFLLVTVLQIGVALWI